MKITHLYKIWPNLNQLEPWLAKQVEIECIYLAHIERQKENINSYRRDQRVSLPSNLNYDSIGGLSNESKEALLLYQKALQNDVDNNLIKYKINEINEK